MDYLSDYRVLALRTGHPLDMDVYDAASISAVTPLSEQSLARRGRSIPFWTSMKGRWQTRRALHVMAIQAT